MSFGTSQQAEYIVTRSVRQSYSKREVSKVKKSRRSMAIRLAFAPWREGEESGRFEMLLYDLLNARES